MPIINTATLALMSGVAENDNMASVAAGLDVRGVAAGLHRPHRLACYLAQIEHESGGYRYDREVWGPTPAQERYDIRTDLGNTPERDGDGKTFMGRTPGMITGRENTAEFRDWCRALRHDAPDFEADPDAMLTDPWEGLGPVWYWETRGLNRYADDGDMENITRRINGGLNGYADRLRRYSRCALVLLGYAPEAVRPFQSSAGLRVDGVAGTRTRAALHAALKALPSRGSDADAVPGDDPRAQAAVELIEVIGAAIDDFRSL